MSELFRKLTVGLITTASVCGLNATGCSTALDETCVVTGTCDAALFDAVQDAPLKQVAIY